MDIESKLSILADAAKYDVSCASSGSSRKNTKGGIGSCNTSQSGICHSWSDDGRCISLLKVLLSNYCIYNCAYCVNRTTNDVARAMFTPEEIANLTINFYRRNYIEGLFLSSGICKNPDYTMELLLKTIKLLRNEHRFNGYIHLKAIPGADFKLIHEAGRYADRMSVNIELPTNQSLGLLAPQKSRDSILKPMAYLKSQISGCLEDKKHFKNSPLFVPAGQSTQLIVGATADSDHTILKLSENLYNKMSLRRVYYSAYIPVSGSSNIPAAAQPPLAREHRLYQADWLLRFYGFSTSELFTNTQHNLNLEMDPKCSWALNNLNMFPIDINRAGYETLIRVPGIGVLSAKRICMARRHSTLDFEHLKKIGVVLKRARYFITCKGRYYNEPGNFTPNLSLMDKSGIYNNLRDSSRVKYLKGYNENQISIFSYIPDMNRITLGNTGVL